MTHWFVFLFLIILTLYALFAADFNMAFFNKGADDAFDYITSFVLGFFVVEITLNGLSEDNYLNSFYFWLDVLSTISLLMDI